MLARSFVLSPGRLIRSQTSTRVTRAYRGEGTLRAEILLDFDLTVIYKMGNRIKRPTRTLVLSGAVIELPYRS